MTANDAAPAMTCCACGRRLLWRFGMYVGATRTWYWHVGRCPVQNGAA